MALRENAALPARRTSSMARARAHVPVAWLQLSVVLSVLAAVAFVKPVDPDFWWHLATGDRILDSGIPRHDPFSWTATGRDWVAHEWLSEAIIAAVQSVFGYGGNLALFIGCGLAALVIMYVLAYRSGASSRVLLLLALLASATMVFFLAVRPQVFTWTLFAVFFALLAAHERANSRSLWVLPALTALWVNLHLGFVYGLMLVGCWLASRLYHRLRDEDTDLTLPALVLAACVGATLLNPQGWHVWTYPFRYLQDRDSLRVVAEWRSPFQQFSVFLVPYYLAFAAMGVALLRRRVSLYVALVTACVLVLSVSALRNVPFVALMLLPVAGTAFSVQGRERREAQMPLGPAVAVAAGFLVLAVAGGIQAAGGPSGLGAPPHRQYPEGGVAWIERNAPGARLYNEYTWGGYLIYEAPAVPVFVDGRTDFYRAAILDDYVTIGRVDEGWEQLLDRYRIDTLLLRKRADLADALRGSPGWTEVFTGDVESVFVRSD